MRMLDRIVSLGIVGTLGFIIAPVSLAHGFMFGADANGFIGTTIDCTQWEDGSFQRSICTRIQERATLMTQAKAELDAACGSHEIGSEEHKDCVHDHYEQKREEEKAKREEIKDACDEFDRGTEEFRSCVQEHGEMDMSPGKGLKIGHILGRRTHGLGMGGPKHIRGEVNANLREELEECRDMEDKEEHHACMVEVRTKIRAEAKANSK